MIELAQSTQVVTWIDEGCAVGARLSRACAVLGLSGLSARTLQRWREGGSLRADGRAQAGAQRVPANRLREHERWQILEVAHQAELSERPPSQIVPALADQGRYIASEARFYRVLRAADQLAHRGKAKAASRQRPAPLQASAPNQLWSWDITALGPAWHGRAGTQAVPRPSGESAQWIAHSWRPARILAVGFLAGGIGVYPSSNRLSHSNSS